jgi:hypothetical protein
VSIIVNLDVVVSCRVSDEGNNRTDVSSYTATSLACYCEIFRIILQSPKVHNIVRFNFYGKKITSQIVLATSSIRSFFINVYRLIASKLRKLALYCSLPKF